MKATRLHVYIHYHLKLRIFPCLWIWMELSEGVVGCLIMEHTVSPHRCYVEWLQFINQPSVVLFYLYFIKYINVQWKLDWLCTCHSISAHIYIICSGEVWTFAALAILFLITFQNVYCSFSCLYLRIWHILWLYNFCTEL